MDHALYASATGMAAQQRNLDVVSDNLANADVAGFKGSVATFEVLAAPGERGIGTVVTGEHSIFTQGKLMKSPGAFDLAIDGPGFFVVADGKGRKGYTRDGEFSRAADGSLRNAQGWRLDGVHIPQDALSAQVESDGRVIVTTAQGKATIGRVGIAEFAAPEALQSVGSTLFAATTASGRPRLIDPAAPDAPRVRFGMLEKSNVSIIESMMEIMAAQRAYEANAKGVQAADEMLRIANNLQRG